MIKLTIPMKPLSVNLAWQGRRFKSLPYRSYEKEFRLRVPEAKTTLDGRLSAHYKFYLKNPKMTDADNLIKVTQDLIVKLKYIKDDRLIWKYTIEKFPVKKDEEDHIEVTYRKE